MAHSYAIDFFAWPGIRERFVFAQHRYCSNTFWHLFNSCLHVLWPYEFRDCYFRNATTGQYSLSPSFEKRLFDINAWTMSDEMFKKWPEFYSDFPVYNKFPMHITSGAGAALKMPNVRTKSLPAPESESRRTSATLHRGSLTTDIAPEDEVSSATTSAPFAHTVPPLAHAVPTSSLPFSASNAFYSVQAFDDWWGAPMQFGQHQNQHQHQHTSQSGQGVGREMGFQAGSAGSRPDHINGMYGLSF